MLKFTELTKDSQQVAIKGFIEDAFAFDFVWDGMNEAEVMKLLSLQSEHHRFDEVGVLMGKVEVYQNKEYFIEGGMY